MHDTVNWGILGAAKFAREHMAPAMQLARGARLAALATRSPEKAAAFLSLAPDLRLHASYDAMLEDPALDAIYIPLPNTLHEAWTLKALAAGKHVLTEKPMAMAAEGFDPLIAARDASGLLAAEAYMIVHHPQWQRAKALYEEGAIGRLTHVTAAFSFDNRADTENIRNRPETGGGALRDIGVYTFGGPRFVTGCEPQELTCQITWENSVDVLSRVTADFGTFTYAGYVSTRMHPRQEVVFHGEAGVLTLATPFNAGVFGLAELHLDQGMRRTTERFPRDNHYVHQIEAFGRSIREGAAYPCSLEFSRGTQAMIDMAFASAGPPPQ